MSERRFLNAMIVCALIIMFISAAGLIFSAMRIYDLEHMPSADPLAEINLPKGYTRITNTPYAIGCHVVSCDTFKINVHRYTSVTLQTLDRKALQKMRHSLDSLKR